MELTAERVSQILSQALEKAKEFDLNITVAVVDETGKRRGLLSMEKSRFTTIEIAEGKALACAGVQKPTVDVVDRASRPVFMFQMIHDKFIFAQGGVPILENGEFVGACGVSGGNSPQEDEDIAYAGVAK